MRKSILENEIWHNLTPSRGRNVSNVVVSIETKYDSTMKIAYGTTELWVAHLPHLHYFLLGHLYA